jgi:hypothetical protein
MEYKVRDDLGAAVVSTLTPPSWKRKIGEADLGDTSAWGSHR